MKMICRKCKRDRPLSEYRKYPSGTVKPYCKRCYADYQIQWKKKKNIKRNPDYDPDHTQMRHPNAMVMEGNVQKMMKKYAENEAKINNAHLPFEPQAGLCDQIIKGM
jgi:hypothetical protein